MWRHGNVKMALQSIKTSKWRSLLTMLGIIIGVVSVVTTVSLGEGVKQQLRNQIGQRGSDLVTVLPGKRVERDNKGNITSFNPIAPSGTLFSETDYTAVESLPSVDKVTPFARVTGLAQTDKKSYSGNIFATSGQVPDLLRQKVEFGSFFSNSEQNEFAVIGVNVAEQLFGENVPVGKSFKIRDQSFVVQGIFEEFDSTSTLFLNEDYNNAIFIPYQVGRKLMGGTIQVQQILAKPKADTTSQKLTSDIDQALLKAHGGQPDFTVLEQEETLALAANLLDLVTRLIAGIAAISLIVGGIGVMNIMLVSVSERTGEIGIRKAVGATNRQILSQFLTEAVILSLVGGVIGVVSSVLLNFILRVFTDLQPVITLPIMGVAVFVAVLVGAFFGATPALRAARKDPIEALRHE